MNTESSFSNLKTVLLLYLIAQKKSLYGVIQDCENKRLEKIENTILPTDRLIPVNSQEVSLVTAALCPRCDTKQQCTQDDIPEKPEQWQH